MQAERRHSKNYEPVSRARYEAEIFTDDTARLPAVVMREAEKTAALEISQLRSHAGHAHTKDGSPSGKPQKQKEPGGHELSYDA
ncbi:hypothetical protein [Pandoraea oxalativorans]|uniref:Uncharacterized protein n=1 Tax=Pandoraea oxalativorans TaxID=573737 RepID=A0A0G3IFA9_9BURK|nr:hypothetical protein [Pandoraea oxalativorans]AKK24606.1 hypothetical protein MB84_27545 [Pandoraea oxalativorans]AKK24953.1 hypothetical protein MB84_29750 [Pandoraea oxalativorans]